MKMRIAQLLHRTYQYVPEDFVREMFRQILHREADEPSLIGHLQLMAGGLTKNEIATGMLTGPEAGELHRQSPSRPPHAPETIMGNLQLLFTLSPDHLIHHLYVELLGRAPDQAGFEYHLRLLHGGTSPLEIVILFMHSDEWREQMSADRNFIARKLMNHYLQTL